MATLAYPAYAPLTERPVARVIPRGINTGEDNPTGEVDAGGLGGSDTILCYDLGLKAWSVWPSQDVVSMWRVRDGSTGIEEIFAGTRTGNVKVLNRPSATTAFTATATHVSALGAQGLEKSPRHLYLYFKETGAFTVNVTTRFDFRADTEVTQAVSMLGDGDVLDSTFVLDTSILGGQAQIIKRLDLRGTGEFLEVEVSNSTAGEQWTWLGYEVLWRPRRLVRR